MARQPRVKGNDEVAQAARKVLRGATFCPFCGRSGGHVRDGSPICGTCRRELAPTKVRFALWVTGFKASEVAAYAGVSTMTVQRAARGEPLGADAARKLAEVLQLDPELLEAGEPLEGTS